MSAADRADVAVSGTSTGAASVGGFLRRTMGRLDDRLNPILVKELRQAVRARYVLSLFLLFLIVQLGALAAYVTRFGGTLPLQSGQTIFWILYGMATGTCALLVPIYCGARLSVERVRPGTELFYATSLRPASIIWGKLLSGLVVTVLIYSACAPFMAFTYLLRGIDLPTIFLSVTGGVLASAFFILLALFIASMPTAAAPKVILVVVMMLFGPFTLMSVASILAFVFLGAPLGGGSSWADYGLWLLLAVVAMGHLFVWTVALMSPLSANRALPMRGFITGAWLVTGIIAVAAGPNAVEAWAGSIAMSFCLMYLVAICEREQIGPRVARAIPRRRWLRPLAFLLYSGAAGGVAWSSVMLLLTLGVAVLVVSVDPWGNPSRVATLIGRLALPTFAASMSALLLRNATSSRYKRQHTWATALAIQMVASIVLVVVSAGSGAPYVLVSGLWAAAVGTVGVPWFARQVRAFRPYSPDIMAVSGGAAVPRATIPVAPRALDMVHVPYSRVPPVQSQTGPPAQDWSTGPPMRSASSESPQDRTPPPAQDEG